MKLLLENWNKFVNEYAQPKSTFALYVKGGKYSRGLILYDMSGVISVLDDNGQLPEASSKNELEQYIFGVIDVGEPLDSDGDCYNAYQVDISSAQKGYGPLIYDLAMYILNKDGVPLTPDRRTVSPDASGVWNFYKSKRGDVASKPFDDIENPRTPSPEDDCRLHKNEPLDSAYMQNSDKLSGTLQSLVNNHNEFVKEYGRIFGEEKVIGFLSMLLKNGGNYTMTRV